MEDVTRPCAHCGRKFTPSGKRYSMAATYCPPCAREYRTEYRAGRADAWHAKRAARCHCGAQLPTGYSKFCSHGCRTERDEPERRTYTCAMPACHNMCRSSQPDAAFCSNPCKLVAKKIRIRGPHGVRTHPHWVMSQPMLGPTLKAWPKFGPTLADWPEYGPTRAPDYSAKTCESCGRSFMGGAAKRFCSDRCFRSPINDVSPMVCDVEFATCPDTGCGKLFVFDVRLGSRLGCCPEHSTRIQRRRRKRADRARKRGQIHEPYTLREIAERDGWRCHLCGGKVPDRPYTAHDKDATIDHLIPQSHGGDDIRSNVALAHNRCNWERGDKGLAQLRLTG